MAGFAVINCCGELRPLPVFEHHSIVGSRLRALPPGGDAQLPSPWRPVPPGVWEDTPWQWHRAAPPMLRPPSLLSSTARCVSGMGLLWSDCLLQAPSFEESCLPRGRTRRLRRRRCWRAASLISRCTPPPSTALRQLRCNLQALDQHASCIASPVPAQTPLGDEGQPPHTAGAAALGRQPPLPPLPSCCSPATTLPQTPVPATHPLLPVLQTRLRRWPRCHLQPRPLQPAGSSSAARGWPPPLRLP